MPHLHYEPPARRPKRAALSRPPAVSCVCHWRGGVVAAADNSGSGVVIMVIGIPLLHIALLVGEKAQPTQHDQPANQHCGTSPAGVDVVVERQAGGQ